MDIDYMPPDFMDMEQHQPQNSFTQEFVFKSTRPVGGLALDGRCFRRLLLVEDRQQ